MMARPCQMISMSFMFIRYQFSADFSLFISTSLFKWLMVITLSISPLLEVCEEQINSGFKILYVQNHMVWLEPSILGAAYLFHPDDNDLSAVNPIHFDFKHAGFHEHSALLPAWGIALCLCKMTLCWIQMSRAAVPELGSPAARDLGTGVFPSCWFTWVYLFSTIFRLQH